MIVDTRPIQLEPLPRTIKLTLRAIAGTSAVVAIATTYLVLGFLTDFDIWSPAVHTRSGTPLGPTPYDTTCITWIREVEVWQGEDTLVFQRHRLAVALWLWKFGPDGFPPSDS